MKGFALRLVLKQRNKRTRKWPVHLSTTLFIAAEASEPEANKRGSSLISRRLHYRGLQLLFPTKRKELWLCANGRFRMRNVKTVFLPSQKDNGRTRKHYKNYF